jgi:hypothetical protein
MVTSPWHWPATPFAQARPGFGASRNDATIWVTVGVWHCCLCLCLCCGRGVGVGQQQRQCAKLGSRAVPLVALGRGTVVMMVAAACSVNGDDYF